MNGIGSHIVLVGFMGSGKTTVGKLLAASLGVDFVDMDSYIEIKEKKTIQDIFKDNGEAYFRTLESRALSDILSQSKKSVVSTGGGVPCFGDNMDFIKANSLSVYLKVGSKRLANRLKDDHQRPLLQNKTNKELLSFVKEKMKSREIFYNRADIKIRAIDAPENIKERIVNRVKAHYTRFC